MLGDSLQSPAAARGGESPSAVNSRAPASGGDPDLGAGSAALRLGSFRGAASTAAAISTANFQLDFSREVVARYT
jgi:hypothetical protein